MTRRPISLLAIVLLTGCATQLESRNRSEFARAEKEHAMWTGERSERKKPTFDGTLDGYVRYALEHNPELRATFEDWRASTERITRARALPEPVISYAYFVRRVETRVGPQRHRFGVSQTFPWPTKLSAGADAASLAAQSAQRQVEARALSITRRVAEAYWRVWLIERSREVQAQQRRVLGHFSAVVRSRLEVGQAGLADLGQVDLSVSRVVDVVSGLEEKRRAAKAALVAAVGAPEGTATPVRASEPNVGLPSEDAATLRAAALAHPRVQAMGLMAESRRQGADAAGANRYPGFTLGVDYIETGEAQAAGVPDSGKDPIIVKLAVSVPLWGGVYGSEVAEAEAESAAFRARESAARDAALAQLESAHSDVRDAVRRESLYRSTLVPQAETVYGSVLGGYQTGRSTLPAVLLAQRELLDIQLALYGAEAQFAIAWARLEEVVGRPVDSRAGRAGEGSDQREPEWTTVHGGPRAQRNAARSERRGRSPVAGNGPAGARAAPARKAR